MEKVSVLLIASQMPQQELGLIAQLLQSQGYRQQPMEKRQAAVLVFATEDATNSVGLKFYQEIGALRLELKGEMSHKIGAALGQYMETLTPERLEELFDMAQSDMERRIYAILMVLSYIDATAAMAAMRTKYFDEATDATREGVVQGLAFLETPDVGTALEAIERAHRGTQVATLARRAIDGLCERGLIRESVESFKAKIESLLETNPKAALEELEKYCETAPAPELRALHARALRLLGRLDDAGDLLATISIAEPDAVEAFCERALMREAAGFSMQAMNDVQAALACDPDCALATEIYERLSLVLNQAESTPEQKIEDFTRALAASPNDVNLLCQRAECWLDLKKSDEAIKDLVAAQNAAPNDPRLPMLLAEAYLVIRHLGCALDQATKAQKNHVAVHEIPAWLLKPRVFLAMNLPERAISAIHEIPAELRDDPMIVLCTGIIHEMLKQTDEASACYAACGQSITRLFAVLRPHLYTDLPLLRTALGGNLPLSGAAPTSPLGDEPADPFFKRCDTCGALTMKRRTYCKECSNGTFFT